MPEPRPFHQGPFAALPEQSRRPHDLALTTGHDLNLASVPFGRMRVHYRTYGGGEPLLLVHGLMTSSYSWRYVVRELGEHFRLIIPDLPGAGRSGKPADRAYHPRALTDWLAEFQGALGIKGCLAVGNSLGGYLCMRAALADPAAFRKLVNIHSPAQPLLRLQALHWALKLPGIQDGLASFIRGRAEWWAHRFVHYYDESLKSREEARAYGAPLADSDGSRAFVRILAETLSPAAFAEFCQTLGQRKKEGKPFPVPLLLMYARQDPMVPPGVGNHLQSLVPGADFIWLDETSHFAHVDSPDKVVAPLLAFLQQP